MVHQRLLSISGGAAIDALGNATNLCAGIAYTITLQDANGCSTKTIQLTHQTHQRYLSTRLRHQLVYPGCDGTAKRPSLQVVHQRSSQHQWCSRDAGVMRPTYVLVQRMLSPLRMPTVALHYNDTVNCTKRTNDTINTTTAPTWYRS
ncbi:MAG: hypothetical protein IPG85_08405 [Bacteroidetes bacterium]|nr:hypothetical protein [Bacteroidota bacterium]